MSARKLSARSVAEAPWLADLIALSFVSDRKPTPEDAWGRAFWRDCNSGDYGNDCLLGEAWARRFIGYHARHPDAGMLLPGIVKYMVACGRVGGVEVGFLETVEQWARRQHSRTPACPLVRG